MIDIKLLLNDFESVSKKLETKKVDVQTLQNLKDTAHTYKKNKQELETLQSHQNKTSKLFGEYKKEGKDISELKNELELNKQKINLLNDEVTTLEKNLQNILFGIPNLPDEKTPIGKDEADNIEIKRILSPKTFDFTPKEHWELAQKNHWIDFEAGVKLAKSRFSVLRGMGARLNRALINFMLDHNQKAGFEMVVTPVIVNKNMLFGTGQLPKFEDDMFKVSGDLEEINTPLGEKPKGHDLYLISTSEITLTNLYNDTIIPAEDLPIMMTAQTPCFRKEAGSAGRDTRGIIRQHQFDKVELVAITHPKDSQDMQLKMLKTASDLLCELELPHRYMQLCSGDLGFSAGNTIDIEVWLPGQNCYREISSVSNTQDFQARRAKIRFKDESKNSLVHTLNGSSLAVGRTLVAIMENYQTKDGDIEIPQVLKKYL
ncbi:serine--tRNA ligase [Helicobacter cappadocius]|uniref:Serine--tRNA ligase n=1 Tax=Helicobacter cappadocius TaxID=3063998 RepID=A0AA90ST35_9HELI|nr:MULTISPECIES: serine--tRNA ligase [unclassified Helicobacter]MDO7253656.1 serine--tRNA ligase [Helicobacter sp. faydin-H75]MDP2539584.1 serine--tRNA ligase [Helicobacter sp. faydin-H76]